VPYPNTPLGRKIKCVDKEKAKITSGKRQYLEFERIAYQPTPRHLFNPLEFVIFISDLVVLSANVAKREKNPPSQLKKDSPNKRKKAHRPMKSSENRERDYFTSQKTPF
jgi:hypothetical protein